MSKIHPVRTWQDNDTLDPALPNEELSEIVGEMNGHLTRDNVRSGELLPGAKFAADTFNIIEWLPAPTAGSVTTPDSFSDLERWTPIASTTIDTPDCRLTLIGAYSYDNVNPSAGIENQGAEMAVRVDGDIVARSGVGMLNGDSLAIDAAYAVGAGAHRVEMVTRYASKSNVYAHVGGGVFIRASKR